MSATRLDRWACPLCDWVVVDADVHGPVVAHAMTAHDGTTSDRLTTGERLARIPQLVVEVQATVGHPNPGGRSALTKRTKRGSEPLPIDASVFDALASDDGRRLDSGVPVSRLLECSRLVWEGLDSEARAAHPQPWGAEPTLVSEAHWLAGVWPTALVRLDLCVIEWIDEEVRWVHDLLASIARCRPRPAIRCLVPGCVDWVRALAPRSDGSWLWADVCGSNHRVDRHGLARLWSELQPVTLAEASSRLGVPVRTLTRWWRRGVFSKCGERGNAALFQLDEVRRAAERLRWSA